MLVLEASDLTFQRSLERNACFPSLLHENWRKSCAEPRVLRVAENRVARVAESRVARVAECN